MKYINWILKISSCLFTILLVIELFLFSKGIRLDWQRNLNREYLRLYGEERIAYAKHVGWANIIGSKKDNENPKVDVNVWPNGMRECRKSIDKKSKINVAFVGCSYTFGHGVAAPETMVYRLNEKYPNVTFDNWGVSGWGAMPIMLLVDDLAKSKKYDLICYNFHDGHLIRNTFFYVMQGDMSPNMSYVVSPYAEKNMFGEYKYHWSDDSVFFLFDRLLFSDIISRIYIIQKNNFAKHTYMESIDNQTKLFPIAAHFINKMNNSCKNNNVKFVLVGLDDHSIIDIKKYIDKDIETVGVANSEICGRLEYRVLNNPNFHPNGKAHAYWAEKFSEWFDKQKYLNKK